MSKKSLGFFSILSLTVGTMVGVGILITPTLMAKFGKYGFMAWPAASLLCLGLAFMFSQLSSISSAGGPAGFTHEAFGNLASFQVSWAHWIGFTAAQGIIAYSFGQYVAPLFSSCFGCDISFWLSLGVLWLITLLSCFMTILSVSAVVVVTFMKVAVLVAIILFGLPYLDIKKIMTMPSVTGDGMSVLMAAMSICLLSFIGLEMATLPSSNVKNPKVTVPLATITGTLIAAFLYTFSYAVVGSAFSMEFLSTTGRPMYEAANLFLGSYGGTILTLFMGIGFFASINGILFAQSYILKYASTIKILPKAFQKETSAGFPLYSALFSALCTTGVLLALHKNPAHLKMFGAYSACFVSIAYLWSVISFRHLGGNPILWAVNFLTVLVFLSGSLESHMIPAAILIYCAGFFVYGMFVTNKKLSSFS